jgi:hypothetical protein
MKRTLMTIALACVLSSSALAGDIPSGGIPSPPPASQGDIPSGGSTSPGDIPSVGAPSPGEIPTSGYAEQAAMSGFLALLGLLV